MPNIAHSSVVRVWVWNEWMRVMLRGRIAVGLGALLLTSACAAHGSRASDDGTSGGDPGSLGGAGGSAPTGPTLLYAHTDTTLYQLDPGHPASAMARVGDFDCIGQRRAAATSMTDLAVTKDGRLFGVSEGAAFPLAVQGNVVHCEQTWSLPQTKFYGLTVAPENTVASQEVLIGADGQGGLYQIDEASGVPTQVGTLGVDAATGSPWALSGDIVFMANNGNPIGFATVRTCGGRSGSGCSTTDTLIEVDVKAIHPGKQSVLKSVRGPVVRGAWCTNAASPPSFGSMFGIVAYMDRVYGFSRSGDIVEIHNADGSGCLVSADPTLRFAGAGVTTTAPVSAPPPK
jgi:hypothetical protein